MNLERASLARFELAPGCLSLRGRVQVVVGIHSWGNKLQKNQSKRLLLPLKALILCS
ncbi:hypothetical protein RHMOL_Rhmol08G0168700 [Rhododendron molle]|uniref:Uncharacterized protein n=1 Tax=Rhododendron molle TaxID=49168 RepID=A0ACC0MR79_RHOML|nr:hypothetical protein RHMOL_Rhmol08G0168700 [Rhododendron molle]